MARKKLQRSAAKESFLRDSCHHDTYRDLQRKAITLGMPFADVPRCGVFDLIRYINRPDTPNPNPDLINEYDIVVGFRYNDGTYNYSLYTAKDDVDVSKVAKNLGTYNNLGGGGHKKAAGFVTHDQIIKKDCVIYIEKRLLSNGVKIIIA